MTQPPVTPQPVSISGPPRAILLASRLCWVGGIFKALTAVVLVLGGASEPFFWTSVVFVTGVVLVTGVAYSIAGYLLSKSRRLGGWIAVIVAATELIRHVRGLLAGRPIAFLTTVLNAVIGLAVLLNWRGLQGTSGKVGA